MNATLERKEGIKVSRETLDAMLRSPNLRRVMKEINSTAIGSKVSVICKDPMDHSSYMVPGRLTKKKPDGIIIDGRLTGLIPYKIIQFYTKN